MIRFIFKWVFRLVLVLIVLAVVAVLAIDPVLRMVMESRIRAQTGMDAQIGRVTLGLLEPTLTIKDLKLFNPSSFGGTLFLSIPEIHAEYDRAALAKSDLHVTLLRFNLGELDIVKNQAGQTNIFSIAALPAVKKPGSGGKPSFTKETGLVFTGIDVLNVSIGKAQFIDLADPKNNREQVIGIENCVMKNVKTPGDLGGLAMLVALRGGGFFGSLLGSKPAISELLPIGGK